MATSSSTSCASAAVPPGFHYETRYVVLNFLGMLPVHRSWTAITEQGDAQDERERSRRMKEQIKEELKQLEEEVSASLSSSGFDRRQSPVFCPPNPQSSVEDCLAAIGDGVSRELGPYLSAAVETLLTGPLDYQRFQSTTLDLGRRTEAGWSKVLVPLLLLQALQSEGKPLKTLLQLGLRCLQEDEAQFIIQQGGWGKVLDLVQEELAGPVADDSNDIYILSEEQPDQLSPPSSLLCSGDNGERRSWHTESLAASLVGHESWAQVVPMDPEDVKSLDSSEGAALAEERSENNSSNSDIVHVEREEAELLEEAGDGGAIDESMMSVLGTERDLAALRAEFGDPALAALAPAGPASTPPASLVSLEEPVVIETPHVSSEPEPAALPQAEPEPEPAAPVPVEVETAPQAKEISPAAAEPETPPEPASKPKQKTEPEPEPETAAEPDSTVSSPPAPEAPAEEAPAQEAPKESPVAPAEVEAPKPAAEPEPAAEPAAECPVLLYGGAVVVLAALAFSIVLFRRRR